MAGTLRLEAINNGTVNLQFTPDADFDSGSLYYWRSDTGAWSSAAAVSGRNTVSSLANGIRVMFTVMELDSGGTVIGLTAPVTFLMPRGAVDDGDSLALQWRTDRHDWQGINLDAGADRLVVPTNVRGYWYQQRIRCRAQNRRLTLSTLKLHVRIHGRGESAVS